MKITHAVVVGSSLVLCSVQAMGATCGDGSGEVNSGSVEYVQKHKVVEAVDGLTPVKDTVRLRDRSKNSLCFVVNTIHSNLHLCSLYGEAKHIRSNIYAYSDEGCKVEIQVTPRKVSLSVTDPKDAGRNLCNPVETFGCGANTAIQSGVFLRTR